MAKQKIYEILITALISAGIAFLQTLLSHITASPTIGSSTADAGLIGAGIAFARKLNFFA